MWNFYSLKHGSPYSFHPTQTLYSIKKKMGLGRVDFFLQTGTECLVDFLPLVYPSLAFARIFILYTITSLFEVKNW
jgi:hypothetical protein